jgi:hypothetical protein
MSLSRSHTAALAVACPWCRAAAGEPCPQAKPHPSRVRLRIDAEHAAHRAYFAQQAAESRARYPDGTPDGWTAERWYRIVHEGRTRWRYLGRSQRESWAGQPFADATVEERGSRFRWEAGCFHGDGPEDIGFATTLGMAQSRAAAIVAELEDWWAAEQVKDRAALRVAAVDG